MPPDRWTIVLSVLAAGLLTFAAVVVIRRVAADLWWLLHAFSEMREGEPRRGDKR